MPPSRHLNLNPAGRQQPSLRFFSILWSFLFAVVI